MLYFRFASSALATAITLLLLGRPVASQTVPKARVESESTRAAAASLAHDISTAVSAAGGDTLHQHVHLVVGFSTGHFSQDPLAAQAAREIATSLTQDFLTDGDRVSTFAWEMSLWGEADPARDAAVISGGQPTLSNLWPLTPRAGSAGGHDTENALVQITDRLSSSHDAAILLLANTAASISTPDQRVIGQNSAAYQAILKRWTRVPQVSDTGASAVLPFTAILANNARVPRTLDAVILVPRHFNAAPLREPRGSSRIAPSHRPTRTSDLRWLLGSILVIALIGGAYLVFRLGNRPGSLILVVGDSTFELNAVGEGQEICHLAGSRYPDSTDTTVRFPIPTAPPCRIASFTKDRGNRVLVQTVAGSSVKLALAGEAQVDGAYCLKGNTSVNLGFVGEVFNPPLPPQTVRIEISVSLKSTTD